ncbi:unnamed protein product [Miscanthus lutarioriparius]|uniref:Uncharacterized protein n=1 Tax=Miscanthus lutarioriparius TaxID=422564 RepID=A0A811R220_9POAL|nr:unnamed protein product [Miscanthus lutarioriparius]
MAQVRDLIPMLFSVLQQQPAAVGVVIRGCRDGETSGCSRVVPLLAVVTGVPGDEGPPEVPKSKGIAATASQPSTPAFTALAAPTTNTFDTGLDVNINSVQEVFDGIPMRFQVLITVWCTIDRQSPPCPDWGHGAPIAGSSSALHGHLGIFGNGGGGRARGAGEVRRPSMATSGATAALHGNLCSGSALHGQIGAAALLSPAAAAPSMARLGAAVASSMVTSASLRSGGGGRARGAGEVRRPSMATFGAAAALHGNLCSGSALHGRLVTWRSYRPAEA